MTAEDVRRALRGRHPATQRMGIRTIPGPWTVVEEFFGIDVLALSAVAHPPTGSRRGARYPRVGYEVKVSRRDFRAELLCPTKRSLARAFCNEFLFAVPKGLLTKEELAFEEPEYFADPASFQRENCPGRCYKPHSWRGRRRSNRMVGKIWDDEEGDYKTCPTCEGKSYIRRSRVEEDAPTLWVPRDAGLIEVTGAGCRVVRSSPLLREVPDLNAAELGKLVRWVSARPDARHEVTVRRVQAA